MTNGSKITLAVVIIIVIVLLGYWLTSSSSTPTPTPTPTPVATQAAAPTATTAPVVQSNTTIDQDMAAADAQLKAFNQNVASVDSAINDKPIN